MAVDLAITNGVIVTPNGRRGPGAGIAIDDGTIVAVGDDEALPAADKVIDADGEYLAPGIVDAHVHTRSPGEEFREDWKTASRAAAAGGVTSVIAMPNTDPVIDRPERLETVYELIKDQSIVDAQSYGLVTDENLEHLQPLVEAGAVGFKCFLMSGGVYAWDSPDDGQLLDAMAEVAETDARIGFHQENADIVNHTIAKFQEQGRTEPVDHHYSRPVVAELEAIQRVLLFSEESGCPITIFHVSGGSGAEMVADAKSRGVDVTAETAPHYLQFTVDDATEKGNAARINPPLREREEQDKLWEVGIHGDGIDWIATDHSPYTDEEKGADDLHQNTWNVGSGMVGLETQVPALLSMVNDGKLTLEQWLALHSRRPAQVWGMYPEKGSLQVGTDADIIVFDPTAEWTLDRATLHSKFKVTPFHDETFRGKVSQTVVRGEIVYDRGEVVGDHDHGTVIGKE